MNIQVWGYQSRKAEQCVASTGEGRKLHANPYEEVFVIQQGCATYTVGSTTLEAKAGQIVIVQAGVPHKFISSGSERLVQVDIHHSPKFITKWLED